MRPLEWLASLLVLLGVILIAAADPGVVTGVGNLPAFVAGNVLLTFGVRLAIDCGKDRS